VPTGLEETMWNVTDRPAHEAGIRLLTQDYRAALTALKDRQDLTAIEQLRRRLELAEEFRGRCAQERKAINAQVRADREGTQESSNGER
jgi:hypothetical protein